MLTLPLMMNQSKTARKKPVPLRTCVACREARTKKDLVRLVMTPAGAAEIDAGGRKPGRGAYLCRSFSCWQTGLQNDRLEHALRAHLDEAVRQELLAQARDILEGA